MINLPPWGEYRQPYLGQTYSVSPVEHGYCYTVDIFDGKIQLVHKGPFIGPESAAESAQIMIDVLMENIKL